MMSHLEQAYQFDIHMRRDVDEKLPPQGAVVVAKDIEQGLVYQNGDLKVTAFTVDHAPIKPLLATASIMPGTPWCSPETPGSMRT